MKKFLFLFLTSVLAVFLVTGCADDSSNNSDNGGNGGNTGGQVTTPTMSDINSLQGTYDIEFFYTDGGSLGVVTTDCNKVTEYGGTTQCDAASNIGGSKTSVEHKGEVVITVNEDNSIKIQSKVEMYGDGLTTVKEMGANYNFTDFNVIPASAISDTIINDPATGKNVKGVHGRNAKAILTYNEATTDPAENNAANSTYQFSVLEDGTVVNTMTDTSSYVSANVIIRMKKTSDEVITLDANTPYDSTRTDNFNSNITYTPAN